MPRPWSRDAAIQEIEKHLRRYIITAYAPWARARKDYLRTLAEWREWTPADDYDEKPPKPKRPVAPPPLAIQGTTGLGKSAIMRIIKKLCSDLDIPTIVLCANHQLVKESYSEWWHYHGRAACGDVERDWDCQQYDKVQRLTRKHHFPQSIFCVHHCENGRKWTLGVASEGTKRHENAKRWFRDRGINPDDIEPCRWQSHLRGAMRTPHIATVTQAASDTLFVHTETLVSPAMVLASKYGNGGITENSIPRLPIIDESAVVADERAVGMPDLAAWAKEAGARIDDSDSETTREALESAIAIFGALAGWLGAAATRASTESDIPVEIRDRVLALSKKRGLFEGETALWEQVRFDAAGDMSVPLRAARAIIQTLRVGGGRVEDGQIRVASLTRIGDLIAAGLPAILLDATLPPEVAAVVEMVRDNHEESKEGADSDYAGY